MAIIDWLIVVVLIVSVLSAARAGLMVEIFSLAGLALGLLLASWDYQRLVPWCSSWVHSPGMAQAAAFLLIALGVMVLAALAGRVVRWSVRSIGLGWADRIAGAAFGLVKGCVLVMIVVMAVAAFAPQARWFRRSLLAPGFLEMARHAAAVAPSDLASRIRSGVTDLRREQTEWLQPPA
ncbi:MAG TPA: CvpA family protein [Acidobacteriaceae bacterium]|nr:CvpA family protein [Acidobacteriaceae bacterium]